MHKIPLTHPYIGSVALCRTLFVYRYIHTHTDGFTSKILINIHTQEARYRTHIAKSVHERTEKKEENKEEEL